MSIYLMADTHGILEADKIINFYNNNKENLSFKDYILVLGDFGLFFTNSSYEKLIRDKINNLNVNILFIDGNHENFDILNKFPIKNWKGGRIQEVDTNIKRLLRGEVYNLNNKKFFVMGGAKSVDIYNRTEGVDWWKEEEPSQEELNNGLINLEKHNYKVDYILTHTTSISILNKMSKHSSIEKLNFYFEYTREKVSFKHWYFGHFHIDKTITNKDTCIYKNVIKI